MRFARRDVLRSAALAPLALLGWPGSALGSAERAAGHTLTLAPRAVVIDGKPVFLLMGSMDYFRCPHGLWRQQLLRAKRSGLNAISFCVAWNFHERSEGVFNFEGDADIGRFIDTCGELGLYAFPRVGPFICDEWEAAGHPAWLYGRADVELRSQHEATLASVERWFAQLVPIIAARQVTRGGAVVLVQQENEYYFVGRPRVQEYQATLVSLLRRFGIEVPITDCNGARAETRIATSLMTQNSGGAKSVALLRKIQPDKPAIITELYTDYMNMWGWPVTSYPTSTAIYQQTVETLAAGGMYSYFMFYGGTNFGFWASTTWKSDESFVTTRYYARAPVAEGGAFNDSFWATKAANLLARGAERFLTAGVAAAMPVTLAGPVRGEAVQTPQGYLLFVLPQYPEQISSVYHTDGQSGPLIQTGEDWPFAELATQPGTLHVHEGAILELAEPSSYPSMLPFQLQADVGVHIDYSNATFLGVIGPTGRKVLLLRGAAGRRGIVAINGKRIEFVFSAADPVRVTVGGVTVLGLSREQADRTWFADGRALIGPYFVGEARGRQHECLLDGAYTRVHAIAPDGAITMREVPAKAPAEARVMLQEWVAHPLPEINMGVTGWKPLDAPVGVEALGAYWGYSWYRAALTSATSRTAGLLFTEAADRLTVFANGKRAGVWGRGPGAMRDPLPVELAAGRNELLFLCDNMGRLSEGVTPDRKGIRGPAYVDARLQPLPRPEWSNPTAAPSNTWQFQTYRAFAGAWSLSTADGKTSVGNLHRARYLIEVPEGEGLKLSLLSLPHYAWVLVDGQIVGEHAGDLSLADGVDFSSFILDSHLRGRMATLEVVLYAESRPDLEPHLRLYSYRNDGALTNWAFKPWTNPTLPGTPVDGDPTWWQCRFEKPAVPGPFFLVMEGLSKGQAYINGHALGRYWEIGPQHALYVPDTWLEGSNQLTIFDEAGRRPDKAYLIRDARVPSDTVLI